MKIENIISLESGDLARNEAIEDVFAWIGGYGLPEVERKPFGRVRGNAFTLADIDRISEVVRREGERPIDLVFDNQGIQHAHEEGIRAARANAERRLVAFRSDLRDDLLAADLPPSPTSWTA